MSDPSGKATSEKESSHLPPLITCFKCMQALPLGETFVEGYFHGAPFKCQRCDSETDRYEVARNAIANDPFFAFGLVGARSSLFTIKLKRGGTTTYKYSEHGIPPGARILNVNYSPIVAPGAQGSLHPVELHGNEPMRSRRGDSVTVTTVTFGTDPGAENDSTVFVTWVPPGADAETWRQLIDAFASFSARDYQATVVPANVAVESALSRFLTMYFLEFSKKSRVQDFLQKGATYAYQLNELLPMVAALVRSPPLTRDVLKRLNSLKQLRNDLAHRGSTKRPLEKEQASEILAAAVFGFRYIQLVERAWTNFVGPETVRRLEEMLHIKKE